ASAITGGKPVKTMWLTWRYTLSAFLVPFIFVLSDPGIGLMFEGGVLTVVLAFVTSVVAVVALAVATGAWLYGPVGPAVRILFAVGAVALLVMEPLSIAVGVVAVALGSLLHYALPGRKREAVLTRRVGNGPAR